MWSLPARSRLFDELRENPPMPLEEALEDSHEAEEGDVAEDEQEEGPQYEQCGLETRANEIAELGPAQSRGDCFGCIYMGERNAGAIREEKFDELMDLPVKSIGQTDTVCLMKEIHRRYEIIRSETNSNLMPGERPLPEWTTGTRYRQGCIY